MFSKVHVHLILGDVQQSAFNETIEMYIKIVVVITFKDRMNVEFGQDLFVEIKQF